MNDREFIELLNLYVDHEITPEDALRLEVEVLANPKRREVYDQYCRMQKACSMLAEEQFEGAADSAASVIEFPAQRSWRLGPMVAGLAAAAAIAVVFVDLSVRGTGASPGALAQEKNPAKAAVVVASAAAAADAMKPVFTVRPPSAQASVGSPRSLFASMETPAQMAQFDWIGEVHVTPVLNSGKAGFLLGPRTELKAAVITDLPASRDEQEPFEMTAFRFER